MEAGLLECGTRPRRLIPFRSGLCPFYKKWLQPYWRGIESWFLTGGVLVVGILIVVILAKKYLLRSDLLKRIRGHAPLFTKSILLDCVGRVLGNVEIYLIAYLMDIPLTWVDTFALGTLTVITYTLFVFIPSAVGVLEASFVGYFALMGYDPAHGLSLELVRRMNNLFWIGLGTLAHINWKTFAQKIKWPT